MDMTHMKRISVGDLVVFKSTTGRVTRGTVVQMIAERRQPTMVLIERLDGGRAIRLEDEVEECESYVRMAG